MSPGRNRPHTRAAAPQPPSFSSPLLSLISLSILFCSPLSLSPYLFSLLVFINCPFPLSPPCVFVALTGSALDCFSVLPCFFCFWLSLSFLSDTHVPDSGPGAPSPA